MGLAWGEFVLVSTVALGIRERVVGLDLVCGSRSITMVTCNRSRGG